MYIYLQTREEPFGKARSEIIQTLSCLLKILQEANLYHI